jgi:two-component system chemotaxis sensor kinase CheA
MESNDLLDMFVRESEDLLRELEASLLGLETDEDPDAAVARVFRAAHTLKGNAGMVGLSRYVRFAHAMEHVIDRIRSHKLKADPDILETLLLGVDVLTRMTEKAAATGAEGEPEPIDENVLVRLETILGLSGAPQFQAFNVVRDFDVAVRFPLNSFQRTPEPMELIAELAAAGEVVSIEIDVARLPALEDLDPTQCFLWWNLSLRGALRRDDLLGACMFTLDDEDVTVKEVDAPAQAPVTAVDLAPGVAAPRSPVEAPPSAVVEPSQADRPKLKRADRKVKSRSAVRVDTQKLDRLVDLVGELVIALSQVTAGNKASKGGAARVDAFESVLGIGRDLQDQVMSLRMVPMNETFERFRRPIRDLAQELGKMVQLQTFGTETELDKNVIDALVDPLKHMLRNSIAHGLESPAERVSAGKEQSGHLILRAAQEEGHVVLEISDDGRGIDTEAVLRKARERGLVAADKLLNERQIYDLLFLPGFSTAKEVSEVSGRGVGLDVVRRNVEALRGAVDVTSVRGKGTTFRIRLPLTLAIIDGMNVQIGDEILSIPLLSVVELLESTDGSIRTMGGQSEFIDLRGELIPLIRLAKFFRSSSDLHKGGPKIVVVESGRRKFGILVDNILGMAQAVIKPMETSFRLFRRMDTDFQAPRGIGGATILNDGTVGLVLDIHGLESMAFDA